MDRKDVGEVQPQVLDRMPVKSDPSLRERVASLFGRAREAGQARTPEIKGKLVELAKDPEMQRKAVRAVGDLAANSERAADLVMRSRESRLAAAQQGGTERGWVYFFAKTAIEAIPGVFWGYGIGDAVTLVEAIRGQEIKGRKLDKVDRVISLIAAGIPFVPATPFREGVRKLRTHVEDTVAEKRTSGQNQLPPSQH